INHILIPHPKASLASFRVSLLLKLCISFYKLRLIKHILMPHPKASLASFRVSLLLKLCISFYKLRLIKHISIAVFPSKLGKTAIKICLQTSLKSLYRVFYAFYEHYTFFKLAWLDEFSQTDKTI
ncbi:MAG: hypothetical protein VB120_07395, partial [Lachnospiraceae bacterium]|nr:hypothetical protein [Lachnospiraceae bacterium]